MEPHQTNQKKHINPESTPHKKKKYTEKPRKPISKPLKTVRACASSRSNSSTARSTDVEVGASMPAV
jgi:hypothetical protein